MTAKVLIYIHYDPLAFENDLNVWLQTDAGITSWAYWDADDIDGFIDYIYSKIREANDSGIIDLRIVQEKGTGIADFDKGFASRNIRLLVPSKTTWTECEIEEVIRQNFNKQYKVVGYDETEDDRVKEGRVEYDGYVSDKDKVKPLPPNNENDRGRPDGKISLAELMIKVAEGEKQ